MKTPSFNLPEIPAAEQTPSVWQLLQIILQLQDYIRQLEAEISRLQTLKTQPESCPSPGTHIILQLQEYLRQLEDEISHLKTPNSQPEIRPSQEEQIILQQREYIRQLEDEISRLKKHKEKLGEVKGLATDLKVPPTLPLKETTPTVAETTPTVAEPITKAKKTEKSPSQAGRIKRRVSALRQPIFIVFKNARSIPFIGLLILIVWLPLPYGSNHGWAWAVMEVWIFGMALLWLWQYLRGQHKLTPVFYKAIPILVIWVIWLIYITFQCTPLPYAWIQWLSPRAAEAYAFFNPTHTTLSVDPHSTAVGLLKSLSYVLLFTLTLLLVNTRSRLRWVAWCLVFSGVLQAFYGSVMTLSGLEYGFFHEKVYYREVATGTFINRNHLAGYLVMCLSVGIGLLIAQLGDGKAASTWRKRVVGLLDWLLSPKMLLRLFLVIMVIALVMTHSRMGNTAFFASLLIAGILTLMLSRRANRATVILLVSLIVIDIFIVGAWFGVGKVAQRLEQTSFSSEKRDEVDIYSIPYWQDYFWTGSGLGSYYTTFPRYQGADVTGFWDHAHNDYLEFAAETGIIGAWLLGVALLLTLAMVLNTLYRRRQALNRGIAFGVTMAITALIIHSIVDFNLQIPANAATFMLILGLGWVVRYLPSSTTTRTQRKRQPPSRLAKSVALSLMAGLIYLVYVAGSWGLADLIARQARTQMAQWPEQKVEEAEWTATYETSVLALRLAPHNPDLLMTMGQVYYWKAIKGSGSRKERLTAYQRTLDYFLKAIEQKPTDASLWGQVILLKHYLGQYDVQFLAAFEYTTVYGRLWDVFVQHRIVDIGLVAWYRFPKNVQSIVIATIERGMQVQPNVISGLIKEHQREWVVCAYGDQLAGSIRFCR